jgi:16S rRNA G1207 methylase RsmC
MSDAANTAVAGIVANRTDAHIADLGCGEGFLHRAIQKAPASV